MEHLRLEPWRRLLRVPGFPGRGALAAPAGRVGHRPIGSAARPAALRHLPPRLPGPRRAAVALRAVLPRRLRPALTPADPPSLDGIRFNTDLSPATLESAWQ